MINNTPNGPQTDITQPVFDGIPITSASLFWRVHYLRHSSTFEALPLIFWLVENLRPRISVMLGMDDPVPYFALCQAVAKFDDDNLCLGVDLPPEEHGGEGDDDAVAHQEILDYNDAHYPEFSQIVSGDHAQSADLLSDVTIDTLVVGRFASHALQDEIDKHWLPRMSARGVVLFLAGGDNLGDYIAQVSRDGESFILDTAQRIRLALYGDQHNEQFRKLCRLRAGKPGYLAVRNVFMRIGEAHRNSALIEQMNRTDTVKEVAPEHLQQSPTSTVELGMMEARLADALTALKESQDRAEKAELSLTERLTDIGELGCELGRREASLVETQTSLEESRRHADKSKETTTALQATLDTWQRDMKDLGDRLEAVEHERNAVQQRLAEVEHERNEMDRRFTQILHSTSWRVTKPLRHVAHVVLRK